MWARWAKPKPPAAPAADPIAEDAKHRFSLRTFESLKLRNYRYYWASGFSLMAAMSMSMLASGWFVYKLTGSSALLGLTMLANAIPILSLSPLGGHIADRAPKKVVLTVGMLGFGLVALWIALSTTLDILTWHFLVVSSFLQGVIMSLVMPSRQSIISEIVGRDKLMNAVALNTAGMNVNQIGAPAIAGFIVAAAGIAGVYYLIASLFLLAAILILPLDPKGNPSQNAPKKASTGVFGNITDGFGYVRRNDVLSTVLVLSLFTVLFSMPFRMLLPVFTEDILHAGPEKLGLLMSMAGIGALAGSLVIASLRIQGRGMLFLHTGMVTGLSIIAFTLSTSYAFSLGIMVVTGIGQAGGMALSSTLVQSYTEDAYLGRVMSLFMMQWGVTSLGIFGVSVVAEFVGIRWAVGATAVALVAVTLAYYIFSDRIRKLP